MKPDEDRKLTTILCADVAGYSRLMNQNEGETLNHLKSTRQVFQNLVNQYGGRIVNMTGDGLVCDFSSVVKAVQCAVEIQNKINKDNSSLPDDDRMLYRIGINLGDVIVEGEDIFGEGVNVAARLEAMAPIGGICISGSVFEQVKNKLPRDFKFLGNKDVKNISEPVAVYSLALTENPEGQYQEARHSETARLDKDASDDEDARIRAYVKRQAAFYRRAMTFGALIFFLFVINMVTSADYWWFLWPAGPFAFILLMDAIRVFGKSHNAQDWEERKINELKARQNRNNR